MNNIVEENSRLNAEEYNERKIVLMSYPRSLFIQLDAPCNQDCLFCSRPSAYRYFSIDEFKKNYEKTLLPAMERAERLNLTGSGELLLLPEAKKILDYFNQFKYTEKMFATNGSSLTPKMMDTIASSANRYVIHISLHSCMPEYHRLMTKSDNYGIVLENLAYIKTLKQNGAASRVKVNFIFLATRKNISTLCDFVKFAYENNADGIIVYYNYVYRYDQRELSCFFIKEETNRMLESAFLINKSLANKYGRELQLSLPPRFGQNIYPDRKFCGEAWSQLMINPEGDVITCDIAGDSHENILNKDFMDVWNGNYLTDIRKSILEDTGGCSKTCPRANPASVNTFRGHLIIRGKNEEELKRFMDGTG